MENEDRSAKSWRAKAEWARALAAETRDARGQGIMLDAARGYQQLADRAEKREAEMKSRPSN